MPVETHVPFQFVFSRHVRHLSKMKTVTFVTEMEIVPEGKNFRLVSEDELPAVADVLVQYMPESLKVTFNKFLH